MRRALFMLPCLAALGCGGLDNRPLETGVVRGRLASFDLKVAVVSVLGEPSLSATPDATGAFELTGVPRGEVELFAVASTTTALRFAVDVPAGDAANVGELQPLLAGSVNLSVHAGHHQRVDGARVEVLGTPLKDFVPDVLGEVYVGPLPVGCYELRAVTPGFGRVDQQVCLPDDDELELELDLPDADGSAGREGCLVAGCEDTYVCQSDGRCEGP